MSASLLRAVAHLPTSERILQALRQGQARKAGGLWGGSAGLVLAMLAHELKRPFWVQTADDDDAERLADDVATFGLSRPLVLPERARTLEGLFDPVRDGTRARALMALLDDPAALLIGSIRACVDEAPTARAFAGGRLELAKGQAIARDEILEKALAAGLRKVPLLLAPGEVSLRGDVLDIQPLAATQAYRLEFFAGVLESIRTFDPATQSSVSELATATLGLGQPGEQPEAEAWKHLVRKGTIAFRYEPLRIAEREKRLTPEIGPALQSMQLGFLGLTSLEISSLPSHDLDFKVLSAGSAAGSGEADPVGRLRMLRGPVGAVTIHCRTEAEQARLTDIFAHKGVDLRAEQVVLATGTLSRGFRIPELATTVLTNLEFMGVPAQARVVTRPVLPSKAVQSFFELGPNDLVVHAAHGIARFLGLERIERGNVVEDHLRLLFADEVQVLVAASKIHLVQKYIGAGDAAPKLDKFGGKGFQRRKDEVQQALFDMAGDLLEVQAARERTKRPPYPRDELETQLLDGFPFVDTPDQQRGWQEIQADLEKDHPMDRLLCGDVGFGKTELALRAAFKVAITGGQVAILVPTTVLADQHFRTFRTRFAPFGLEVEMLSRYRTAREKKDILHRLGAGRIDVLVGTHAILSEKLAFTKLAMLVVDEEQRFGVGHKEILKKLRADIDVLTLSATPIPRTLHGSLLGIRPISTLGTPPPGRVEVETRVLWREPQVFVEALGRELERGGQVFVLHNTIAALPTIAREVERAAPTAKVAIGHGKLSEREMERTVRAFVAGHFDVLVSTTIIENGLDIANANTILIDRADRFGLAELHQLRGRVGRSDRKAYCYLLMDRDAPPDGEARKRLKAIEEFGHLGAGFAIAMKDLEIRGAGNLLGPQQSGHIAAIGYDMYCRLLREAVTRTKSPTTQLAAAEDAIEVDVDLRLRAFLPDTLVADSRLRLEVLREMDGATSVAARDEIARTLQDRFGKLPQAATTLLDVFLLKHLLAGQGMRALQLVEDDRLVAHHEANRPLGGAWLDCFVAVRRVESGKTHLLLPKPHGDPGLAALGFALAALLGHAPVSKTVPAKQSEPLPGKPTMATMDRRWFDPSTRSRSARRS